MCALRAAQRGTHHTAGRSAREQRDRPAGDIVGRHHATGRLHDEERTAVSGVAQLVLQVRGVARDARRDVRVDEGGRDAFELGTTRHHLVRQRNVLHVGELFEDDLAGATLVRRIHEREQVHHGDRAHAELLQTLHPAAHGVFVELEQDVALEVHALADRDASAAPRDRCRARIVRVPDLFFVAAPQLDLVAVTFGDEQAGGRAVHLDHRVVGGGGAVHDDLEFAAEPAEVEPEAVGELAETVHDPGRLVVERDGVLSSTTSPAGVTHMRSVNVPPTSMPTR